MRLQGRRRLALCIVIAAVVVGYGVWFANRSTNPPAHVFQVDRALVLTEEVALDYTRRALVAEGKDRPGMRPWAYRSDSLPSDADAELFFSRNQLDPDSGYVIWSNGYGVRLQRDDDQITCWVHVHK